MKLTKEALKIINQSNMVKGKLADLFDKSHQTIQRWVDNNDIMLTHSGALAIYKEDLSLDETQIIIHETKPIN